MIRNLKQRFNLQYNILAMFFGLLYYLPYYFKNLLNGEVSRQLFSTAKTLESIKEYLLSEAKPLYGLRHILGATFSFEFLTLLGVLVFIITTIKFVDLIFSELNNKFKFLIFLLLFVNPFIYYERGWPYQFFMQSLITILYYISFYYILKYNKKPFSLVKFFLAYLLPILSLVIGLNFFMPSFFHFIILCMVIILKRHIEITFKTIFEIIYFIKDYLIIVVLGSLIYVVEIISLWHLFDYSLFNYLNNVPSWRHSNLDITGRLLNIFNFKQYNIFLDYIGLIFAAVILLKKRNKVNVFLFFMVCFVYASSYFLYIFLDIDSSFILQFPNYNLTFFISGLLLIQYQYIFQTKLLKPLLVISILFLGFFYFSSYFLYYINNKQHKQMERLAYDINNYIIKTYKTSDSPNITLIGSENMYKINKPFKKKIFPKLAFFNLISIYYAEYFNGVKLGMPNITSRSINSIKRLDNTSYVRNKGLYLLKDKKIFPHHESVFFYEDVYYVMN